MIFFPKILLVSASGYDSEQSVLDVVKKYCKYFTVKSRSLSNNVMDLVVEVRTSQETELARDVAAIASVNASSLLAHDGEVTY